VSPNGNTTIRINVRREFDGNWRDDQKKKRKAMVKKSREYNVGAEGGNLTYTHGFRLA